MTSLLSTFYRLAASHHRDASDARLLRQYLDHRDEGAFAALVQRQGPRVLAACRQVLQETADIEDAFQATFLLLLQKARQTRWQDDLGGWLFVAAHRVALRVKARSATRRRYEGQHLPKAAAELEADADLSWREAVAILHEELDRLPERFRRPLLLCHLEGLSRDEAARQLGWSLGTVKGRLERGRQLLRQRLDRRGVTGVALLAATVLPTTAQALPAALLVSTVNAAQSGPSTAVAALLQGVSLTMTPKLFGSGSLVTLLLLAGLLAVAGLSQLAPLAAQPPTPQPPAPQTKEHLLAALGNLEKRATLLVQGNVAIEQPARAGSEIGGSSIVINMGGQTATLFTGGFEAWRSPEGELVVMSHKKLPEVAIYAKDEHRIIRATSDGSALDAEALANELPQLLNPAALKRYAEQEAKLQATAKDGDIMYQLPLGKRLLRGGKEEGLQALAKPEVLRLEARITCTTDAKVKALEFRVVRSDPVGALLKRAGNKQGSFQIEGQGADPDEVKKQLGLADGKEGATTIITLTVGTAEPSPRVRTFAEAMRKELQP